MTDPINIEIILKGPPGSGKSELLRKITTLLENEKEIQKTSISRSIIHTCYYEFNTAEEKWTALLSEKEPNK